MMKSKLLKFTLVIVVAIVAVVNVFNAQKPVELSDVAMANVEALAGDEDGYVKLPCTYQKDEYCTYTVKLMDGRTQQRKEFDLMNYN